MSTETIWIAIGLSGQVLFSARFILQWLFRYAKRSTIPIMFWYCSILGGGILLAYSLYRKDLVFILGNMFGIFIYARNLWLIYAEKRTAL
ncbi:MAG: lipid-A-disaccharide synthase N-terminal domain-containing protein [Alphaproteobacteria bacterium]